MIDNLHAALNDTSAMLPRLQPSIEDCIEGSLKAIAIIATSAAFVLFLVRVTAGFATSLLPVSSSSR